jgi:uncharacterized membrane protein SpoIIM required for sporulation
MDLDSFIGKYRPEWQRLETACAQGPRGLAKSGGEGIAEARRLYLRASAHLAEARTTYGDPQLDAYLNLVVSRAHAALYGAEPKSLRNLAATMGVRFRSSVRRSAPFIFIAAAFLVTISLAMTLWVASSRDAQAGLLPSFAREAIRRAGGHRADIGVPPSALSTLILVNNVQVAFLAFATGIGLGIGTLYILVQNGTLLGALAGGYAAAGKSWTFWSLVLPHGLLEMTAVCIAAGAGLRLGWSLVDPGDRSRGVSLAEAARDCVMIVIGVIPAFGVAALIEGFVTGRTGVPALEVALGVVVAGGYIALLVGPRRYRRPVAFARR